MAKCRACDGLGIVLVVAFGNVASKKEVSYTEACDEAVRFGGLVCMRRHCDMTVAGVQCDRCAGKGKEPGILHKRY